MYDIDWDNEEGKKVIKLFWWCSVNDKWQWFPFEDFFIDAENIIWFRFSNLAEGTFFSLKDIYYNVLSEEEKILYEKLQNGCDWEDLEYYEQSIIMEIVEEDSMEIGFLAPFLKLKNENPEKWSLENKIFFIDKLIHIEHSTGNLWGIGNLEELREQFEEEHL